MKFEVLDFKPSPYAIGSFLVILLGYIAHSSVMQYLFYYRRGGRNGDIRQWKSQPNKDATTKDGIFYGHPLVSSKPLRGPYHRMLTTFNLIMASLFAGVVSELCVSGRTKMRFESVSEYDISNIIIDCVIAVTYENVAEYYWHRLMHFKQFYAVFHKYHHFYKSPEVW